MLNPSRVCSWWEPTRTTPTNSLSEMWPPGFHPWELYEISTPSDFLLIPPWDLCSLLPPAASQAPNFGTLPAFAALLMQDLSPMHPFPFLAVSGCFLRSCCFCWLEWKVAAGIQIFQLRLLQTLGEPTRRFLLKQPNGIPNAETFVKLQTISRCLMANDKLSVITNLTTPQISVPLPLIYS